MSSTTNDAKVKHTGSAGGSGMAASVPQWEVAGAVGRWDKGAVNNRADVETVQEMLRIIATVLHDPRVDPGGIDGEIARDVSQSTTVKAIEAFQSRFLNSPDGLIGVGGRTWRSMLDVLKNWDPSQSAIPAPANVAPVQPKPAAQCFFPFDRLPSVNWTDAPRQFGSRRASGKRAHAGCDLYFPVGTTIHAIADGKVVRGPYPFYAETFALEVDHGDFIARYGEIQGATFVKAGDTVKAGQPIAKVGRLVGIATPSAMLHLELYDKSGQGPLTVSDSSSAKTADGRPFFRRRDLIDPTPKLNVWKNNLAPA